MKIFTYSIVAILLMCNIYMGVKYYMLKHEAESISDKYASLAIKEERVSQKLKTYSIFQQALEGVDIPDITIQNRDKNFITLSSLPQDSTDAILCFRFKDTHCDACIQHAIRLLNEIPTSIQRKIVVLCGYTNYVHFTAFESKQKKEIRTYNVEEIKHWDIDQIEQSYFFVIQNGKIHNVFIPLKEDDKYTQEYIHSLLHKYWNLCNDDGHSTKRHS